MSNDDFLTPALDWSDMFDSEMLEVVIASRKRWELLKGYFEYQSKPSEDTKSAIGHLSRIINHLVKCEALCSKSHDKILMVWLRDRSIVDSLTHLMQAHKFFVEKEAQEHATQTENGSTWIDIFDIEVAMDAVRKLLQHGLDKGILTMGKTRLEFDEYASYAAQTNPKVWEAYRSKVVFNG